MRRLLFVFLDGVGLGPAGGDNPLSAEAWPALEALAGGQAWTDALATEMSDAHLVRPIDATLGIDGLPQSGTGQATLFTGANCAATVGRHFGPFPHSKTYPVLDTDNLFHRVRRLGRCEAEPCAFANAYPPAFFNAERRRWTVTTRLCAGADVPVRGIGALRNGRALPADLTGRAWRDHLGLDVPTRTEAEAGRRLVRLHREHALTLFEYFLTDKAGHGRLDRAPDSVVESVDAFLAAVLDALDPATETLVVTSDHGNLEDTGRKTHTRNPVPLLVRGWAAPYFRSASGLGDVTPAIAEALSRSARA
jgi:hypothetical protein